MNRIRETLHSPEYDEYYSSLPENVQDKYDYVEDIIRTIRVVNRKFIKRLEGTDFYEARVSLGSNEYRTIVFSIDADNFMEAEQVLLLNSFLKKSSKQYKKEIRIAEKILNRYKEEE
ncbi:type II toxin-antitoxin system RelE/ParE family toxin [Prevotella sp. AGR2160]|uniref:type II toxin-antitoxin system RelE/ParE family toxin n=1 Tax=Prevotella sp. AGR2160 TaxID=1280674 RepID=UPI000490657B|nr:type II toxin-antitoxin system RelE/ParE family toxin [Prevotella sp. AGR2160]